jgi:hypothetical protein
MNLKDMNLQSPSVAYIIIPILDPASVQQRLYAAVLAVAVAPFLGLAGTFAFGTFFARSMRKSRQP